MSLPSFSNSPKVQTKRLTISLGIIKSLIETHLRTAPIKVIKDNEEVISFHFGDEKLPWALGLKQEDWAVIPIELTIKQDKEVKD